MTSDEVIERLYDLNVGITPLEEGAPHERPHKPLLLLAAFDLIDEGKATHDRIPWCQELRDRFIARYFPHLSPFKNQQPAIINHQFVLQLAEESLEYGRSPAFRRKILTIYDHQCASCGLRIRLHAPSDVSFIDAAHLIPFAESRNDHPTSGLALC
jgi:predicted restriction endonuclease